MRRWAQRAGATDAASAVEFAILLPLLLTLLFGMISGGLALNRQQQLNHAVREGARFGATVWQPAFPDSAAFSLTASRVRTTLVDLLSREGVVICIAFSDGTLNATGETTLSRRWFRGSDLAPLPAPADPTLECPDLFDGADAGPRVQASVRADAQLEAVVFRRDIRLSADAVSVYEPRS